MGKTLPEAQSPVHLSHGACYWKPRHVFLATTTYTVISSPYSSRKHTHQTGHQTITPSIQYRTILVPQIHSRYRYWNQKPQILATWTLWVTNPCSYGARGLQAMQEPRFTLGHSLSSTQGLGWDKGRWA